MSGSFVSASGSSWAEARGGGWFRVLSGLLTALVVVGGVVVSVPPPVSALTPPDPPGAVNPDPVVVPDMTPGPTYVSGDITVDTTWSPLGSPYVLSGQVRVMNGVGLTLLPGTIIKFDGQFARLVAFGHVLSLGTPTERVTFTSLKDDTVGGDTNGDGSATSPAPGDWYAVHVYGNQFVQVTQNRELSVFDYTDFKYGGYGSGQSCAYSELDIASTNAKVVVSNSSFTDSAQAGIGTSSGVSDTGFVGIYNSHFESSMCGISTGFNAKADIVGNTFGDDFSRFALWSLFPKEVRFWFNRVEDSISIAGNAETGVNAPTRAEIDVRYNELLGYTDVYGAGYQQLTDYEGNWWGEDLNTAPLPGCLSNAEAAAYRPRVTRVFDYYGCPPGQWYRVTGYAHSPLPALSGVPGVLPDSLREANAPRFGPVDTYSGVLSYRASDLSVLDAGKRIDVVRTYRSDGPGNGDLGFGWWPSFSESLVSVGQSSTLAFGDGTSIPFNTDPAAGYTAAPGVAASFDSGAAGSTVRTPDRTTYDFDAAGELTSVGLGDPGHQLDVEQSGGRVSKVTGVSGRWIDFVRSGGVLTSVNDSASRSATFSVSGDRLMSATGVDGGAETYSYDSVGRLTGVTTPMGRAHLAAGYQPDGKVEWVEEQGVGRATISYDPAAQMTSITRADGEIVDQRYDWAGRLVTEGVRGGPTRHVVYDGDGRRVVDIAGVASQAMTAFSASASATLFDRAGDPVLRVDPVGSTMVTTFDDHLPVETVTPDESVTTRTFTAEGRLDTVTDPLGGVWDADHNSRGQITQVTDPLGRTRSWTYDEPTGDLATQTDETGAVVSYTYDNLGRTTSVSDPLGNTTTLAYTTWDAVSATTLPRGGSTSVSFNADRQPVTSTDLLGEITTNEYDTEGRLTAVVDPLGGRTELTHDVLGQTVSTTDARGSQTIRTHTPQGWTQNSTDPLGNQTGFEYDPAGRLIRITDALGQVTQHVLDRAGRPVKVQTPDGISREAAYDEMGRTVEVTVPLSGSFPISGSWDMAYDQLGRTVSVTNPLGDTRSSAYDAVGRMTSSTNEAGTATSFVYDDVQRTVTVSDPLGVLGVQEYDAAGRLTSRTGPAGAVTVHAYDPDGNLTTTTDPMGGVATSTFDLSGRPVTQTDPAGRTITATYDELGRLIGREFSDTTIETYTYDPVGNMTARTDQTGTVWSYEFDGLNRPTASEDPLGNRATTTYDPLGRAVTATDPSGVTAQTGYDPGGRPAVVSDTTGASWVTTYDRAGNPATTTDPAGVVTTFGYDGLNRPTSTKTGTLQQFTTTYDQLGNITASSQWQRTIALAYDIRSRLTSFTDQLGNETTHSYDAAGNRVSSTSPEGRTRTWAYDLNQRLTNATDPAGNTTSYAYNPSGDLMTVTLPRGGNYSFGYDTVGRLATETNPVGETTSFTYNNRGQLTQTALPSGRLIEQAYDTAGRLTSTQAGTDTRTFTYDPTGRMTTATDGTSSLAYSYDNRGLLATSTDAGGTTAYTYDLAHRLISEQLPAGSPTDFTYNSKGQLATIRGATNLNNSYDSYGYLTSTSAAYPTSGGTDSYTYDVTGRVTGITAPGYNTTATYTPDGFISAISQNYTSTSNQTAGQNDYTYTYDTAGRITGADLTTDSVPVSSTTYEWDADSNRTRVNDGQTDITYTYDLADRLTGASDGTTYTYDADGNQLTQTTPGGTSTLGYNSFGELASHQDGTGTTSYVRDPLGRTNQRSTGTDATTYGYAGGTNAVTRYQQGTDPAVSVLRDSAGVMYSQVPDSGGDGQRVSYTIHGDVGMLRSQTNGTSTHTALYDPFGTPTTTGTSPVPLGFQSMITDPHTGLVDMGFRSYNPATGRFTAADNIIGDLRTPVTLNRYTYGNANPITYFDPDGHSAWGNAWDSVSSAVSSTYDTIKDFTSDAVPVVRDTVNTVRSETVQTVRSIGSYGATVVNSNGGVSGIAQTVVDAGESFTQEAQQFIADNKNSLIGAGAGIAATGACLVATGGAGTAGCVGLGFAVEQAVTQYLDCPPDRSRIECGAIGAVSGAVAGAAFVGTGGLGGGLLRAAFAEGIAGGLGDSFSQYLLTGEVDPTQTLTQAGIGFGTAGLLNLRGGRSQLGGTSTHTASTSRFCNSFTPDTQVLMADGSTKPISLVQTGDRVWANDPETNESGPRTVTATISSTGTKDLVDIQTSSGQITATGHHPIWVNNKGEWVDADNVQPGDYLLDNQGVTHLVQNTSDRTVNNQTVHNLTVDDIHTYHVIAGNHDILVHNTNDNCGIAEQLTLFNPDNIPTAPRPVHGPPKPGSVAPRINPQQQAGHVAGTPQYTNRIKQGKPTSVFRESENADALTLYAWERGTPTANPSIRVFDFQRPIGTGFYGGNQTQVRVSINSRGEIHGSPWGPELP